MKKPLLIIATTVASLSGAQAAIVAITANNTGITSVSYPGSTPAVDAVGSATNPRMINDSDDGVTSLTRTYTISNLDYGDGNLSTLTFDFTVVSTGGDLAAQNSARTGFGIGSRDGRGEAQLNIGETIAFSFGTINTGNVDYTVTDTKFISANLDAIDSETMKLNSGSYTSNGDVTLPLVDQLATLTAEKTAGANDGITLNGLTYEFTVVAVPEPSSVALLGLGGLALVLRRRN